MSSASSKCNSMLRRRWSKSIPFTTQCIGGDKPLHTKCRSRSFNGSYDMGGVDAGRVQHLIRLAAGGHILNCQACNVGVYSALSAEYFQHRVSQPSFGPVILHYNQIPAAFCCRLTYGGGIDRFH